MIDLDQRYTGLLRRRLALERAFASVGPFGLNFLAHGKMTCSIFIVASLANTCTDKNAKIQN